MSGKNKTKQNTMLEYLPINTFTFCKEYITYLPDVRQTFDSIGISLPIFVVDQQEHINA